MRSLALRPGDSLTALKTALPMGFRLSISLKPAIQGYRASGSYPGGAVSH